MKENVWEEALVLNNRENCLWELFHENSKNGKFSKSIADTQVLERMRQLHESLLFEGYPEIELPNTFAPLFLPLQKAIEGRKSRIKFNGSCLTILELATVLHYSYGISRRNQESAVPSSFRMVPSAGALYPLELFLHASQITGLASGLYHYNPLRNSLRYLRAEAHLQIAKALIQPHIGLNASVIIFMVAIFERTVFKYGDRGYRFILLEAGHVAQNINLVATALDLTSINLGGFLDREIDDYLEIDGLNQSAIYLTALGHGMDDTQ